MPGNAKGVGVAIAPSPPPHAANPTEPRDVPSKTRNRRRCTAVDLVADCESLLPLPMRFVSELSGRRSNCSEATRFPRADVEPLVALRRVVGPNAPVAGAASPPTEPIGRVTRLL